ncbi:hypothetical protein [Gordonia sp. (in: high G+C Gram-positive bacteria)]|uniref:hypothetical protein n=1 Tax=Gordonia sp. (in: high G+C Gram-positive bacteria) TaxID=84139 RepID=UPI0039E2E5F7
MGSPRAWSAVAVAFVIAGLVGCSSTVNLTPPEPGAMLLAPTDLPSGFNPVPTTVAGLKSGNDELLALAAKATVAPAECRPTADADMNKRLTQDNAAALTARSMDATLANVVFEGARDLTADERERTGKCATTKTTIVGGTRDGAVITADQRKLVAPVLDGKGPGQLGQVGRLSITQMLVVRTDTTTTMPDGATSRAVSFAGYAATHSPGKDSSKNRFTIVLTVAGQATPFAKPFPDVSPPMSDKEFVEVFSKALVAAGKA